MKIHEAFDVRRWKDKDIGIEIEIEGRNLKHPIDKYWTTHNDGSLRGPAVEYVLKAPVHRINTKNRLKSLQIELDEFGSVLQPSDRCGVHIHVNCQDLTTRQVINFATIYLILEDLLVKMCGEERVGNLFCLRASDADRIISGLRICKQQDSMNYMQSNQFRYASINLAAISKFGSVEFRALPTPKNFLLIQRWINILLSIKDYSLNFQDTFNIIENISFEGPEGFINAVLGENALLIDRRNQNSLITEGIRRVQEISYARVDQAPEIQAENEPGNLNWVNINEVVDIHDVAVPDEPPDLGAAQRRERVRYQYIRNTQNGD